MDQEQAPQQEPPREQKQVYDVIAEIFIGSMVSIMGVLVVVTPLVSDMPEDHPWNPVLIDVLVGALYLIIGGFVLYRAWRRAKSIGREPER